MADRLRQLYHRYDWCEYFQLKIEFSANDRQEYSPRSTAARISLTHGWARIPDSSSIVWFLPRDAMHKHGLCCRPVSVYLSVRHIRVLYPNDWRYHQTDRTESVPMTLSELERRDARAHFFQTDVLNNTRTIRCRTTKFVRIAHGGGAYF